MNFIYDKKVFPCPICGLNRPRLVFDDGFIQGKKASYAYTCCGGQGRPARTMEFALKNWNFAVVDYKENHRNVSNIFQVQILGAKLEEDWRRPELYNREYWGDDYIECLKSENSDKKKGKSLDENAKKEIENILNRGNDVEIRSKKDGIQVIEVQRKTKYST